MSELSIISILHMKLDQKRVVSTDKKQINIFYDTFLRSIHYPEKSENRFHITSYISTFEKIF